MRSVWIASDDVEELQPVQMTMAEELGREDGLITDIAYGDLRLELPRQRRNKIIQDVIGQSTPLGSNRAFGT